MSTWSGPENVGILAMSFYTPRTCVNQEALETFDGVSSGKYTIGLGQTNMGYVSDLEDIHSVCLTVLQKLLDDYNIDPATIGRLEVGTETLLDKSKSVKTVLMQLFGDNTDIEGIDTTNACYGGTSAVFNSVNWIESSAYDGRNAIVVCGDLAVYSKGAARPTGGAGAVAMLIGPDAPLVLERGLRASHMEHVYDFYKADLASEYPQVDGQLSISCYLRALDICYQRYLGKLPEAEAGAGIDAFDFGVFHSPFNKLVQKSWGRLLYNDFTASPDAEAFADEGLQAFRDTPEEESYAAPLIKAFTKAAKGSYTEKVVPSVTISKECGNLYTGSVWGGLVSLVASKGDELAGKRVMMFSYGSGLAATMFSIRVAGDVSGMQTSIGLDELLASRTTATPEEFDAMLQLREDTHLTVPYEPVTEAEAALFPGTYYLVKVDDMHRREYAQLAAQQ